jgi:hypothetical protein
MSSQRRDDLAGTDVLKARMVARHDGLTGAWGAAIESAAVIVKLFNLAQMRVL